MTTWILVWLVLHTQAMTSGSAEFGDESSCEQAREAMLQTMEAWQGQWSGNSIRSTAACIPTTFAVED